MYEIRIDRAKKIVIAEFAGVLTADEVDRCNHELEQAVDAAWRDYGVIRLITDTTRAPVQPVEVVSRFRGPADVLRGPDDRYAAVVSSTLAKLQGERVLGTDRAKLFLALDEALAWVTG